MKTYQPSGRIPLGGIIVFIVVGSILGMAVGIAAHLISTQIFFLCLSPLGLAVLSGAIANVCVRLGRVRSPGFALLIGLLLGAVIYGTYWGAGYVRALDEVATTSPSKNSSEPIERLMSARPTLDRFLRSETGQDGIIGYVLFQAEEGMTFSRTSSSSTEFTFSREMTLGYWGLEMLLVIGAAAFSAYSQAGSPYSELDRRWIGDRDFRFLGSVDGRLDQQFISALNSGNFRGAGQHLMLGSKVGLLQVNVVKFGEPNLAAPGDMIVRGTRRSGNRENEVFTGVISPVEYRALVDSAQLTSPQGFVS